MHGRERGGQGGGDADGAVVLSGSGNRLFFTARSEATGLCCRSEGGREIAWMPLTAGDAENCQRVLSDLAGAFHGAAGAAGDEGKLK